MDDADKSDEPRNVSRNLLWMVVIFWFVFSIIPAYLASGLIFCGTSLYKNMPGNLNICPYTSIGDFNPIVVVVQKIGLIGFIGITIVALIIGFVIKRKLAVNNKS